MRSNYLQNRFTGNESAAAKRGSIVVDSNNSRQDEAMADEKEKRNIQGLRVQLSHCGPERTTSLCLITVQFIDSI